MSVWCWPRPPGGTPILILTGKRRSAIVIISRELPGITEVPLPLGCCQFSWVGTSVVVTGLVAHAVKNAQRPADAVDRF